MPIIGNNSSGGKKPNTPTSVSASAGNASATVSFTEPTYEGKTAVATYVATSSPGSLTGTSTTSPITVSSLSNGTAYTFTVIANTPYGVSSDTSSASGSVTPAAPPPPPPPPPTPPPPPPPPPPPTYDGQQCTSADVANEFISCAYVGCCRYSASGAGCNGASGC